MCRWSSARYMFPRFRLAAVFWGVSLFVMPGVAYSQDAHYWTNQYGARSVLLGGSVVGSVNDLSSIYYNPGALGIIDEPELVLAAKVFQASNVIVDDAAGRGNDLDNPRFEEAPGFFAGLIDFEALGGSRLAYFLFTRQRLNLHLRSRQTIEGNIISDTTTTGDDLLFGQVNVRDDLSEDWFGFTWSRKHEGKWGYGISTNFALRNHESWGQIVAEAFTPTNEAAITIIETDVKYRTLRLLWKGGVQYDSENVKLGMTITTPGMQLYGTGNVFANTSFVSQDFTGTGSGVTVAGATTQTGLAATYKSPASIAGGITHDWGRRAVNFSTEWFDAVKGYDLMEPDALIARTSPDTLPLTVNHSAHSVINFGAGYVERFSDDFRGYVSFTTDFSSLETAGESDIAVANWDIFHTFAGADFNIGSSAFTLGAGYSLGSKMALRDLSFEDPDEDNGFTGDPAETNIQYRSLRFLIGFTLSL